MVYVTSEMMSILERWLDEGWFPIDAVARGDERLQRVVLDLFCQGLLDRRGNEFVVTDSGRRLVEAWRTCGRPSRDPWIDSRIAAMLRSSVVAGGRVPEEWIDILSERGFVSESGELSPEAYEIEETLRSSRKRIVLTKRMALSLLALPEGPAPREMFSSEFIDSFEAMNLVARSVPRAGFMAITRGGRLLRRALSEMDLGAPSPVVVNETIVKSLEAIEQGHSVDPDVRKLLGSLGLVTGTGSLTPAARLLLKAWSLVQTVTRAVPTALTRHEILLLRRVYEAWRRFEEHGGEPPMLDSIAIELEAEGWDLKHFTPRLAAMQLEALGLLEESTDDRGRLVLKLTKLGRRVVEEGAKGCRVLSVRSIIEADCGLGPDEEWIAMAREEGLIGSGGPTDVGRLYAALSRECTRSLLITGLEALILKRLPEARSVMRSDIVKSFPEREDEVEIALDKLESKGLIETLPGGRIMLTPVGAKVKTALIGVPSGVATPITPTLLRLLRAVERVGLEDLAALVKEARLDLETVKKLMILARTAKFLGSSGLTYEGKLLLEAEDELNRWRE